MPILSPNASECYWKAAADAIAAFSYTAEECRSVLQNDSEGNSECELAFPQRIVWLRDAPVRTGKAWQDCLHYGGWRFLVLRNDEIVGAVSTWKMRGDEKEKVVWSTDWGPWVVCLADAITIAESRPTVVQRKFNPIFLRTRRVNQAALWLRAEDEADSKDELVIPLPRVCPPLQSLTVMSTDSYLTAIRRLLPLPQLTET
jgi:hypothetical protein